MKSLSKNVTQTPLILAAVALGLGIGGPSAARPLHRRLTPKPAAPAHPGTPAHPAGWAGAGAEANYKGAKPSAATGGVEDEDEWPRIKGTKPGTASANGVTVTDNEAGIKGANGPAAGANARRFRAMRRRGLAR